MIIKLYRTSDDNNVVNKTLTPVAEVDIDLRAPEGQGSFNVTLSTQTTTPNYCYVVEWNKYYYLSEPEQLANNYIRFSAHIDVLMTFRSQILQETGIILRQENNANLYLADNNFPVEARKETTFKQFSSGFERGFKYYLTIGG